MCDIPLNNYVFIEVENTMFHEYHLMAPGSGFLSNQAIGGLSRVEAIGHLAP